jgi:hypothetical protein
VEDLFRLAPADIPATESQDVDKKVSDLLQQLEGYFVAPPSSNERVASQPRTSEQRKRKSQQQSKFLKRLTPDDRDGFISEALIDPEWRAELWSSVERSKTFAIVFAADPKKIPRKIRRDDDDAYQIKSY